MVLHRQTLNYKFTITTHQNILRVSGNEKKTNIAKYLKNEYIYIFVEYFLWNIYTKWMLLTKQKIYWLIIKKQIQKTLIISLKKASSNLLVEKIKSIVAFKMSELVMISKHRFP